MNKFKLTAIVIGYFFASYFFFACTTAESSNPDSDTEEWIELFNGENLEGWDLKISGHDLNNNFGNTFRVEDGLMKVRYDQYDEFEGEFGHIFYEEPFAYYRLIVEYRFVGEQTPGGPNWAYRNNGIMFHSQSAASMDQNQDFPDSIEFQLLGGDGEFERINGNICTPGTHVQIGGNLEMDHCINAVGPTNHGDDWVKAELIAHGSTKIKHLINGEVVIKYNKPQLDNGQRISGGYFALQSESHPTDIRSVRLLNLEGCMDKQANNYKSYFVKDDQNSCEYD